MPARAFLLRWLAAGALLGIAVVYRPVYLVLLIPAFLAAREAPADRRMRAASGLALGALAVVMLSMGIQWLAGGDPTGYGGQRQGIYASQAYPGGGGPGRPLVERRWRARGARRGSRRRPCGRSSTSSSPAGTPLYTLVGRNVGILPYFLPLLLGFLAFQGDRGRWAIPLAVARRAARLPGAAAVQLLRRRTARQPLLPAALPGALVRRRAARRARSGRRSSPSSPPPSCCRSGSAPTAYPIAESGEYRVVSALARRWLPYETTQASVPGQQVAVGNGLWVKLLNHNVWPTGKGDGLRIAGSAPAHLLLGSPKRLKGLDVELDKNGPSHLRVGDNDLRPVLLEPNGSVVFEIAMGRAAGCAPALVGAGRLLPLRSGDAVAGSEDGADRAEDVAGGELIKTPWMKVTSRRARLDLSHFQAAGVLAAYGTS